MDLAFAVCRVTEGALVEDASPEALSDLPKLLECGGPGTPDSHELGPMDEAEAVVRDHLRLLLAPPSQRRRPLAGATNFVDVAAKRDRVAVDDARDDRRKLPRADRGHGFVDETQPLLGLSQPDEGVALLHDSDGSQVWVAEPLPNLGRLGCGRVGILELASGRVLQEHGDEEVSALGTVRLLRLEQPVAAREPAERRPELPSEQHAVAHPEGAADGGPDGARGQMSAVCPLEPVDVVLVQAEHVGRPRE